MNKLTHYQHQIRSLHAELTRELSGQRDAQHIQAACNALVAADIELEMTIQAVDALESSADPDWWEIALGSHRLDGIADAELGAFDLPYATDDDGEVAQAANAAYVRGYNERRSELGLDLVSHA